MKCRTIVFMFFAFILVLFVQMPAFACACCAEPGTYNIWTGKSDAYYLSVIRDIGFDKPADLYMTEAGFESIRGLDPIRKEYEADDWTALSHFDLAASFTNKLWQFNLKTPKGTAGTLVLPMPAQMLAFKVDIHDEENRPNGPLLYKELRFKGSVSAASGFTRPGFFRGTTFFLVFQGRGNGCDNASDFTHWRLEIEGPRADYAFFGKLDSEAAKEKEKTK
ncbi:MAG: hypothetical protein ACT4O9_12270 [Blastocatellia bacterium]